MKGSPVGTSFPRFERFVEEIGFVSGMKRDGVTDNDRNKDSE